MRLYFREYGREYGDGFPLLFLHGGWGYGIYPIDSQIEVLAKRFRILIPDRAGYGTSGRVTEIPRAFHKRAAAEMRSFLDELRIGECMLWGHSDGAVIAALMTIAEPERFPRIIAESIHFNRCKPRSRGFFETSAKDPASFGPRIREILAADHGADYWEQLLRIHGAAWLDILDNCNDPAQDLFGNRLSEVKAPFLVLHGSEDPRTEPGEVESVAAAVPHATMHLIKGAGHIPHWEREFAGETTKVIAEFLS